MLFFLDRLLGLAMIYVLVGLIIAVFIVATDPVNKRHRFTSLRSTWKRLLFITFLWIFAFERKAKK